MSSVAPVELAEGLWSWSCRHPEWHPGEFGAEVVSFAARAPGRTLQLIDPLLPLAELGAERMLMTHGESILTGGSAALHRACEARPWYRRP